MPSLPSSSTVQYTISGNNTTDVYMFDGVHDVKDDFSLVDTETDSVILALNTTDGCDINLATTIQPKNETDVPLTVNNSDGDSLLNVNTDGGVVIKKALSIISTSPEDTTLSLGYMGQSKLISSLPGYDTHQLTVNVRGFDVAGFKSDYHGIRHIEMYAPIGLNQDYTLPPSGNQLGSIVSGTVVTNTGMIDVPTALTELARVNLTAGVWMLTCYGGFFYNSTTATSGMIRMTVNDATFSQVPRFVSCTKSFTQTDYGYLHQSRIVSISTATTWILSGQILNSSNYTNWKADPTSVSITAVRIA